MPFIFDNLTATVIATTVVLILASIQMEATQANTARVSRNVVNTQAQQFATWLEEDLSRIGQNMPSSVTPYAGLADSTQWHTTAFSFDYVDPDSGSVTVQYDLKKTGDKTVIDGNEKELLRLERSPDGGSPARLGYFEIDLLDQYADSASSEDAIAFVRARFSVIAPFQNEETFPQRVHRSVVVPYRP